MNDQKFLSIVEATPLVSIDLLVYNEEGQVLLGLRKNRPAQGFWFVPGGRIRKGENHMDALWRISMGELGVRVFNPKIQDAYTHIYHDNVFGIQDIPTHYVALGYRCFLAEATEIKPDKQHAELKWWDVTDIRKEQLVHPNTRAYFA